MSINSTFQGQSLHMGVNDPISNMQIEIDTTCSLSESSGIYVH